MERKYIIENIDSDKNRVNIYLDMLNRLAKNQYREDSKRVPELARNNPALLKKILQKNVGKNIYTAPLGMFGDTRIKDYKRLDAVNWLINNGYAKNKKEANDLIISTYDPNLSAKASGGLMSRNG